MNQKKADILDVSKGLASVFIWSRDDIENIEKAKITFESFKSQNGGDAGIKPQTIIRLSFSLLNLLCTYEPSKSKSAAIFTACLRLPFA
jgi:hypothetical protein